MITCISTANANNTEEKVLSLLKIKPDFCIKFPGSEYYDKIDTIELIIDSINDTSNSLPLLETTFSELKKQNITSILVLNFQHFQSETRFQNINKNKILFSLINNGWKYNIDLVFYVTSLLNPIVEQTNVLEELKQYSHNIYHLDNENIWWHQWNKDLSVNPYNLVDFDPIS